MVAETNAAPESESETTVTNESFTCERCGFVYQKQKDYAPFLCHRCLRYIGKKVWTISQTLQPAISRPERADV